jgi:hypothetical protein
MIMVRNLLIILLLLTVVLTACSKSTETSSPVNSTAPTPYPPSSDQGSSVTLQPVNPYPAPGEPAYAPAPGDENLKRGKVELNKKSSQILTLESQPPQIVLQLKGSLPTPCHMLRVVISPADDQNRINLEVYSLSDPVKICTQMLQPLDASIHLGSFPSGTYTVWVNGEKLGEFSGK